MSDTTQYIQFGFITITLANLAIVGLLIVVFALAVFFRGAGERHASIIEPMSTQGADGVGMPRLEEQL